MLVAAGRQCEFLYGGLVPSKKQLCPGSILVRASCNVLKREACCDRTAHVHVRAASTLHRACVARCVNISDIFALPMGQKDRTERRTREPRPLEGARMRHATWPPAAMPPPSRAECKSVFNLPVSRPPPAPSEGPGPPPQKTKTNPFFDRYTAVTTYQVRRRRKICGVYPQNHVFTIDSGFSSIFQDTSDDPVSGLWF